MPNNLYLFCLAIAGITNPRQLKVDFEYLRYVISNDHCYTTLTMADLEEKDAPPKEITAPSTLKTGLKSSTSPKKLLNRSTKTTKSKNAGDDGDSDADAEEAEGDESERLSDEEAEESETDLSDISDSESDNDRDSDLDFSVNDRSMRRTRKSKKKRLAAKKRAAEKATKKRRSDHVDVSDDITSPGRGKKGGKTHKKTPNATKSTPEASGSGVAKSAKASASKISKQNQQREKLINILKDDNDPVVVLKKIQSAPEAVTVSVTTPTASPTLADNSRPNISAKKEKKPSQPESPFKGTTTLFASPDIIKSVGKVETQPKPLKFYSNTTPLRPPQQHQMITTIHRGSLSSVASTSGGFVPLSPTPGVRGRNLPQQISVRVHASPSSAAKLASEQDKQLDLIDSIVQEELNSDAQRTPITKPTQQKILNHTLCQNDIPNIVKMLETPSDNSITAVIQSSMPNIINSTLPMPTTTPTLSFSTNMTSDTQLLDDDLLDSLTGTEDGFSEDLMLHVAKLVEDKNLQDIIDRQVLTGATVESPMPIKLPAPVITMATTPQPIIKPPEKESPFVKLAMQREAQKAAAQRAASQTGPRKIVRSDGRIITLPPIEAPTTRGAKRRAATDESPRSHNTMPKETRHPIINTARKDSLETESGTRSPQITPKSKAKDLLDRRTSGTSSKRGSTDSRSSKRLSTSSVTVAVPPVDEDDYDDTLDPDDESQNSEDDPTR